MLDKNQISCLAWVRSMSEHTKRKVYLVIDTRVYETVALDASAPKFIHDAPIPKFIHEVRRNYTMYYSAAAGAWATMTPKVKEIFRATWLLQGVQVDNYTSQAGFAMKYLQPIAERTVNTYAAHSALSAIWHDLDKTTLFPRETNYRSDLLRALSPKPGE